MQGIVNNPELLIRFAKTNVLRGSEKFQFNNLEMTNPFDYSNRLLRPSLRESEIFQFDNQEMTGSFKLKKPLAPAVIARYEAISRVVRLIYYRGVSLVKTTDESCVLDGEIASSCLLTMTNLLKMCNIQNYAIGSLRSSITRLIHKQVCNTTRFSFNIE